MTKDRHRENGNGSSIIDIQNSTSWAWKNYATQSLQDNGEILAWRFDPVRLVGNLRVQSLSDMWPISGRLQLIMLQSRLDI